MLKSTFVQSGLGSRVCHSERSENLRSKNENLKHKMNNLQPKTYRINEKQPISVSATIQKILHCVQNDSIKIKKACENTDLGLYLKTCKV
jgi:hypothetical protein